MDMALRKSLEDIAFAVRDVPYPRPLPKDVEHLHCYVTDQGHCLLAIPEVLLVGADRANLWMYEVPMPVRFVLKKGYRHIPDTDHIAVSVPYDPTFGTRVPDGYEEF